MLLKSMRLNKINSQLKREKGKKLTRRENKFNSIKDFESTEFLKYVFKYNRTFLSTSLKEKSSRNIFHILAVCFCCTNWRLV